MSLDDPPAGFLGAYAQITYAEARIAQAEAAGQSEPRLLPFLDRLALDSSSGGRVGNLIELLLLRARVHVLSGNDSAARQALAEALSLAEPEGFFQTFVPHLPRLRQLVRELVIGEAGESGARRILAALTAPPVEGGVPSPERPEILTARESEILALVEKGLRNQEIAKQLFISLSTVKRHAANIYAKLGVGSRTAAVAKARELGLL